jgi:hypothetical protein
MAKVRASKPIIKDSKFAELVLQAETKTNPWSKARHDAQTTSSTHQVSSRRFLKSHARQWCQANRHSQTHPKSLTVQTPFFEAAPATSTSPSADNPPWG